MVLESRPGVAALALALLLGFFALSYGVPQIAAGTQLRQVGSSADKILSRV